MSKVCAGCGTIIEFGATYDEQIEWVDADQHCKMSAQLTESLSVPNVLNVHGKRDVARSFMTIADDYLAGRIQWREFEIYSKALMMKANGEKANSEKATKPVSFVCGFGDTFEVVLKGARK
jgi:transcription initiation factor TFIIIB Brf1 subunit/transcription initiation factor TFIIB